MKDIFYCKQFDDIINPTSIIARDIYSFKIWKPTMYKIMPKGIPSKKSFFFWWLFYFPKLFTKSSYSIFTVYCGKKLVHYSLISPKCFKFPFMETIDIQIGPCWTHDRHRRKGIASYVITEILKLYKKKNRKFWYITREENKASGRVIVKVGFIEYGKGTRKKRFGANIFVIEDELC